MPDTSWTPLDIKLKGERDYIQSANAWDAIAEHILSEKNDFSDACKNPETMIDVIFKRMMRKNVEVLITHDRIPAEIDAAAQIIITTPDKKNLFGALRERGDVKLDKFVDIEDTFKPDVIISDTNAKYNGAIPVSLSQMYVALTKFWHLQNVDKECKWLATRLQLPLATLSAAPDRTEIEPKTILKKGLGSLSEVKAFGSTELSGRIYFYKS